VDTLKCCLDFVAEHTKKYEVVLGTQPTKMPQYPDAVVREVVMNALAHRDYGLAGATTDITVWDDRLEVRSPGPLPGHITLDNILSDHYSRNGKIMRVLKILGFVEEYGEGVDRMYREMSARLMEDPVFDATDSSVTVTLFNRFLVDIEEQAWLALLGTALTSRDERLALVTIRRAGSAARRHLAERIPESNVDRLLSSLTAKGFLVRVGRGGGTRYQLSDEVLLRVGSTGIEAHQRREQLVMDELACRGSLSTAETAALLRESRSSARQVLAGLTEAGLVRPEGNTRARRYHLADPPSS